MSPFKAILLTIAVAASLPGTASAYNHLKAHPRINELAIEKFVSLSHLDRTLLKYQFFPDLPKLSGWTVTKDGNLDVGEEIVLDVYAACGVIVGAIEIGKVERTWRGWIIDGGHTADEPELYNALRHFYDPTAANGGKSYLTDHVAAMLDVGIRRTVGDPKMDALEWSVNGPARNGYRANRYSWNRGIEYMEWAFAETEPQRKQEFFAAAWRSLGETMHLLSDMTTPAHVRNDAHPWDYNFSGLRPDPYETFVVIDSPHGKGDVINATSRNALDPELAEAIGKSQDVTALLKLVATHTNANYFSADTVAGRDEKGQEIRNANGMAKYLSPLLGGTPPDALGYYVINNRTVAHVEWADGTWWNAKNYGRELFSNQLAWRKAMDSSQDVTIAQAKELIPLAVAGGVKLVDWFIPRVNVALTGYDPAKRVLSGKVAHVARKGSPYSRTLVFNKGPAEWSQLVIDGHPYSETSGEYQLKIENGTITCALSSSVRLEPGTTHLARMRLFLGGPWVESVELKLAGAVAAAPCSPSNPYGDCEIKGKLKGVNVGDQKKARLPTSFPECCLPHLTTQWDYETCIAQKKTGCRAPVLPAGCRCDW